VSEIARIASNTNTCKGLGTIDKEVVMTCFKFMYQKLPGDPEKTRGNIKHGSLLRRGIRNQ